MLLHWSTLWKGKGEKRGRKRGKERKREDAINVVESVRDKETVVVRSPALFATDSIPLLLYHCHSYTAPPFFLLHRDNDRRWAARVQRLRPLRRLSRPHRHYRMGVLVDQVVQVVPLIATRGDGGVGLRVHVTRTGTAEAAAHAAATVRTTAVGVQLRLSACAKLCLVLLRHGKRTVRVAAVVA